MRLTEACPGARVCAQEHARTTESEFLSGAFASLFEKVDLAGTSYQLVPSGDSPDGRGRAFPATLDSGFVASVPPLSFGGSPTEAGESPAPQILKTGSNDA